MQTAAEDVGLAAQSWGTDLNSYFAAMRRYFTFSGRSSRSQFWLYTLFLVILVIVGLVIDDAIGSDLGQGPGVFGATIFVAHLIPSLTVTVRRLAVPFGLQQISVAAKLEATVDLLAAQSERLLGGKAESIKQVLEESLERKAACLCAECRDPQQFGLDARDFLPIDGGRGCRLSRRW
jgi:hypothetical protein